MPGFGRSARIKIRLVVHFFRAKRPGGHHDQVHAAPRPRRPRPRHHHGLRDLAERVARKLPDAGHRIRDGDHPARADLRPRSGVRNALQRVVRRDPVRRHDVLVGWSGLSRFHPGRPAGREAHVYRNLLRFRRRGPSVLLKLAGGVR